MLEAAILLEAGWNSLCDAVWAVEAPMELSISRLMARNNLSLEGAQARLNAQITNEERAARANKVIKNSGSMDFLLGQVVGKTWMVLLSLPAIYWLRQRDDRLGIQPA